jgi:hypothetical protein
VRIKIKAASLLLALFSPCLLLFAQEPPAASAQFENLELGFRYVPPGGMRDLTIPERQAIQKKAAERGSTNTLTLLLALRSGPDDTAADWHTVGIETYPRGKFGNLSDHDASQIFSRRVMGIDRETGQPSDVNLGGFDFVVSTFELREGQLTKHARVYTTVRNGKLLALAFSANSSDVLNHIVGSMASFGPFSKK